MQQGLKTDPLYIDNDVSTGEQTSVISDLLFSMQLQCLKAKIPNVSSTSAPLMLTQKLSLDQHPDRGDVKLLMIEYGRRICITLQTKSNVAMTHHLSRHLGKDAVAKLESHMSHCQLFT